MSMEEKAVEENIRLADLVAESLTWNKMAAREAGSNKIADRYFAVEEQTKLNETIPAILKRIYKDEFTESVNNFGITNQQTQFNIEHRLYQKSVIS